MHTLSPLPSIRFIHTADIHLGKSYHRSPAEGERFEDFFRMLGSIINDAIQEQVDFVLLAGDLFHTGHILPKTFARTIEVLTPLKNAGIPCIAVEGNHDWIHRRDNISWMEALSQMGYLQLLRPTRSDDGSYYFAPFDYTTGQGGVITIKGAHIYGLGYIGTQAGSHVERICQAVTTKNNILLFHVGIWSYSPVEIGAMKPEEALLLADSFSYVALGHGHKPYTVAHKNGRIFAYNPGSPECVNFGEERYPKGYYLVTAENETYHHQFIPVTPRPMLTCSIDLEGVSTIDEALLRLDASLSVLELPSHNRHQVLLCIKLHGAISCNPFELHRERIRSLVLPHLTPLHLEIKNLTTRAGKRPGEQESVSLQSIEEEVLRDLLTQDSSYKGQEDALVTLCLALREQIINGNGDADELVGMVQEF